MYLAIIIGTFCVTTIDCKAAIYVPDNDYNFLIYKDDLNEEDADYNVLFIGNSITFHPPCAYWWGSCGMAASEPSKDYVHSVVTMLEETNESVNYDIIQFSAWKHPECGTKILPNIEGILNNQYNLVVIQLGDNANDMVDFENEYENLVKFVKKKIPGAKIILVSDFWNKKGRDAMKLEVSMRQGCSYVDIPSYKDDNYYYCVGQEASVLGDDGEYHIITFPPVSVHPNDKGMEIIAERIMESVRNQQ